MKPDTHAKILEYSGHWRVRFTPMNFQEDKFSFDELRSFLKKHQVYIRGWSFPFYREAELYNLQGFVQSETDSQIMSLKREFFRLYRTGQFIFYSVVREDSPEFKKNRTYEALEMTNIIWTITEYFEFCKRLAADNFFEDVVSIEISLHRTKDRYLYTSNGNVEKSDGYICKDTDINVFKKEVKIQDLLGASNDLAAQAVLNVYEMFNYSNFNKTFIEAEQQRFFERRF